MLFTAISSETTMIGSPQAVSERFKTLTMYRLSWLPPRTTMLGQGALESEDLGWCFCIPPKLDTELGTGQKLCIMSVVQN